MPTPCELLVVVPAMLVSQTQLEGRSQILGLSFCPSMFSLVIGNNKLLGTSASLLVTSALLVVTRTLLCSL